MHSYYSESGLVYIHRLMVSGFFMYSQFPILDYSDN